ncbi:MAG: cysteine desulfurase IscS [Planctomycetota bacterium]|nr:MAG: cysteine desulfurase IscS [Planctomycetota bacterium]
MIYLDHNASTPTLPEVRAAVAAALELAGNPSSQHAAGRRARAAIEQAREQLAAAIGAAPAEIVFTSGGTEACALGLAGAAAGLGARAVLYTAAEHSAVLAAARALAARGLVALELPVDRRGRLALATVARALAEAPRPALLAVHSANNETGTRQDVPALAALAHEHGALLFADAVQSLGKEPVQVAAWGADLLALSAHKIGGPKGTGALWIRTGVPFAPPLAASQEFERRAGTENVPGIAGFGAAAALVPQRLARMPQVRRLRDELLARVRAALPQVQVHGDPETGLPNTLNLGFPGVDGEALRLLLDLEGVAVSGGSACASGAARPSHVLLAMGHDRAAARGAVRLSLGPETTAEEVERAASALVDAARRARATALR